MHKKREQRNERETNSWKSEQKNESETRRQKWAQTCGLKNQENNPWKESEWVNERKVSKKSEQKNSAEQKTGCFGGSEAGREKAAVMSIVSTEGPERVRMNIARRSEARWKVSKNSEWVRQSEWVKWVSEWVKWVSEWALLPVLYEVTRFVTNLTMSPHLWAAKGLGFGDELKSEQKKWAKKRAKKWAKSEQRCGTKKKWTKKMSNSWAKKSWAKKWAKRVSKKVSNKSEQKSEQKEWAKKWAKEVSWVKTLTNATG